MCYPKRMILALRRIMQQMDHHSRKLDKEYGITVPQIICLYEIHERGAQTLTVLSRSVHLSTGTLVGIIDRLEEKNFVRRTRGEQDRRTVFIEITDKGLEFITSAPELLHNRLAAKLQSLAENEQIVIANSLDTLAALMQEK